MVDDLHVIKRLLKKISEKLAVLLASTDISRECPFKRMPDWEGKRDAGGIKNIIWVAVVNREKSWVP